MSFLGNIGGGFSSALSQIPFANFFSPIFQGMASGEQEADQRKWIRGENDHYMLQQYEYNSGLQEKAQAFAMREAEKARKWNSIGEQLKRAAESGINPLSLVGSGLGSSQAMAGSSSSSVGLPSVSSAPNGIVDLANLSQVLLNSAQGGKALKETSRYDDQIDALLQNYASDVSLKKAQTDAQVLANDIVRIFGKKRASYECLNLYNSALKAASEGRKADADALLSKATAELRDTESQAAKLELPFITKRMQASIALINAQEKNEESQQEANKAAASESRAGAALKLSQKTGQDYQNRISAIEVAVKDNPEYAEKLKDKLVAELLADKAVANNKETRSRLEELRATSIINQRGASSASRKLDNILNWLRDVLGGIFHASFSN